MYKVYKQTGLKQLVDAGYKVVDAGFKAAGAVNNINNIQQTVSDANNKANRIIANAEETANQIIRRATRKALMLIFLMFLLGLVYHWLT
ncbi:MAG: hypothetical protein ISR95_00305 [Candidatus Marinimicrobia bacterium]|nr:hypothetical protein [Candidatus Neomarinimicrobiota bacterium]